MPSAAMQPLSQRRHVPARASAAGRMSRRAIRPVAVSSAPASNTTGAIIPTDKLNITVFSAGRYVLDFLEKPLTDAFPNATFVEADLDKATAPLAAGSEAVILFVNDKAPAPVIEKLAKGGTKLIAMRCAGFDRVDLEACAKYGIKVTRVPTYSPTSIAEHALTLAMALNRKIHLSYERVKTGNYALSGLIGWEMKNAVVGIIGTGAIGVEAVRIFKGVGCDVRAYDIKPNDKVLEMGVKYYSLDELLPVCDIISLHCPLFPSTFHIINKERVASFKPNTMLINCSRGGLVDTDAVIEGIENGKIGALGMDVYENEGSLFFQDFTVLDPLDRMKSWDKRFKLLISYPQVLITPHSAFLTHEALSNIAQTTIGNLTQFCNSEPLTNEVQYRPPAPPAA